MKFVRPDENWIRSASSITATSAATGYAASRVADDNVADRMWWATSGTATLTVNLGSNREVGTIALIHNNGDDLRTITIGGDISTTLSASRQVNGYPKNIAYLPGSPATAQNLTIAIANNTLNWAIGELVIGKVRELTSSYLIGADFVPRRLVIPDIDDDYEHEIRTDLGAEVWSASGAIYQNDSDFPELLEWWQSTKGGTLPSLVFPDDIDNEPRLVRLTASMKYAHHGDAPEMNRIDFELVELSRGILVQ